MFAIIALLYLVPFDMSSNKVCMLKTKDEDKEEGEVSPELPKVLQNVLAQESRPLLPSPTSPSLPFSSKTSLPPLLPHLSSTCSDIPVVCGVGCQTDASQDGQAHSLSKVLLSAISPWLASLIEGMYPLFARSVVKFRNVISVCFFGYFTESISLVDAGPSAGLSFPDLSKTHLSKYLSVCLLPSPSLIAPEVSEVHALLNPTKDVGLTNQQGSELDINDPDHDGANDEPLQILEQICKQNGDTNGSKKDGFEIEAKPRIKAELADVGEKCKSELSTNTHPCGACYKTFESEKNLKMHIAIKHKSERKEIDYNCNQCGEQFNKLTTGHRSLRASLSLKELFERHLWTHKVADFKCNCDNVPDLRPGKVTL